MKFEKNLVFFIKENKSMMKIIHEFYFNVNLNEYFFDVFDINKSFK